MVKCTWKSSGYLCATVLYVAVLSSVGNNLHNERGKKSKEDCCLSECERLNVDEHHDHGIFSLFNTRIFFLHSCMQSNCKWNCRLRGKKRLSLNVIKFSIMRHKSHKVAHIFIHFFLYHKQMFLDARSNNLENYFHFCGRRLFYNRIFFILQL